MIYSRILLLVCLSWSSSIMAVPVVDDLGMEKVNWATHTIDMAGGLDIQTASKDGNIDAVRQLLDDERVDPSVKDNQAIRDASREGHADVVRLLLKD